MNEISTTNTIATASTDPAAVEKRIEELYGEIEGKLDELARLKKARPVFEVQDYEFQTVEGRVRLSQLFRDKTELIVVHNMGKRCSYCTLWADNYNGIAGHLEDRVAFVVATPDDPETQRAFAMDRGWRFRMCSTKGTTFKADMGFEPKPGETWPGFSVFRKDEEGRIFHTAKDHFGPGDMYCGLWHFLALLPTSETEWHPKFHYE